MTIKQEENRTIVTVNNVVIDILKNDSKVWVDVYPYSEKEHAFWFINDENGKQVYWKELNGYKVKA